MYGQLKNREIPSGLTLGIINNKVSRKQLLAHFFVQRILLPAPNIIKSALAPPMGILVTKFLIPSSKIDFMRMFWSSKLAILIGLNKDQSESPYSSLLNFFIYSKKTEKINVQFQKIIMIISKFGRVKAIYVKISRKYKKLSHFRSSSICGDHRLIDYKL